MHYKKFLAYCRNSDLSFNINTIPKELTKRKQWCITRGQDKRPLGQDGAASVIDPRTWMSYKLARELSYFPNIGYVLTDKDPYCVIDLDTPDTLKQVNLHWKIVSYFNKRTYVERSRSRTGFHIWLKVPKSFSGRRSNEHKIEIYSKERFIICTDDGNDRPIRSMWTGLHKLIKHLDIHKDETPPEEFHQEQEQPDKVVIDKIMLAYKNNEKKKEWFNDLCAGKWKGKYPSQSEADYFMLTMLCCYSPNNTQVKRIFRMTGLGKRPKATKDDRYLNRSMRNIRNIIGNGRFADTIAIKV